MCNGRGCALGEPVNVRDGTRSANRVPTEYGLDQEFNSLDAQHEAAEAYIRSQAHDGWTLSRGHHESNGMVAAFRARLLRRRGPQEAGTDAGLGEGRRRTRLSDRLA
jgi:hypothetical protein